MKVRWTPRSRRHLREIHDHIAKESPLDAAGLIERITARGDQIADFPMSGRVVPEYRTETVREVFEKPYRILYRVKPEIVEIVTVIHGARRLRSAKPM